jgi:hypothetical protein
MLGGGCSRESCSGCIQNSTEKGIFRKANCQVFALAVLEICRAPQKTIFLALAVFYSCRAPCGCQVWPIFLSVLLERPPCTAKLLNSLSKKSAKVRLRLLSVFHFLQSKIPYCRSQNCSVANPPPIVNPGPKCTRWIVGQFDQLDRIIRR